ncbi:hypothetical protein AXF42_Ash004377 [Apostasia shenzhenica]|uniref:Uncharacterized protein n=1 Tax=Apostasia shenzhenica TaxID=1088818 RepID=A0A2I0A2R0_9ASPA|nr:hypothetical protein AXF42_Ash004377 [Apostasia shenzhenica]
MEKQNGEEPAGVLRSSIALLQERFRQLQREKEVREEREKTRFAAITEASRRSTPATPARRFLPSELVDPSRLLMTMRHVYYFSFLEKHGERQEPEGSQATVSFTRPWPARELALLSSNGCGDGGDDVDTSLHL